MLNTNRLALFAAAGFLLIAAACGGSADPNSEEAVRDDVQRFFDSIFSDDPDTSIAAEHFPEECEQNAGELALGLAFAQAFLGEIEFELEVNNVEFVEDDRAVVDVATSADLGDLFGGADGTDETQSLWVLQGDHWRMTDDCEAFDDERDALGLSTTTSSDDVFGGGFGADSFGPPVAASLGDALAVGDLTVTITGASLSTEPLNEFDDPPQGVLVVVDFSFENDGKEPTSPWWALELDLFDDQDRTWETTSLPFEDVGPGFAQDFQAAWDVPEGATGFRVIVSADPFVDLPLPDDFAPWEVPLGNVE